MGKDNCCPKEKVITKIGIGKPGKDGVCKNVTTTTAVAGPTLPVELVDPFILPLGRTAFNPAVKGNYTVSFDAQVNSGIQHTLTYVIKKSGVVVNRERSTVAMGNISIAHISASFTLTTTDDVTINITSSNAAATIQEIHAVITKQLT